jgi:sulfur carrier protein
MELQPARRNGETGMIMLTINGKERQLEGPTSLLSHLESLGVNLKSVAVAYNGNVLRKDELANITLSEGDQVEVVRAVGGG